MGSSGAFGLSATRRKSERRCERRQNGIASHTFRTTARRARIPHCLTFWLKELPFALVLILTTLGVAYTSFSKQPTVGFFGRS
jgi:hypothetical protein